MNTQRRRSKARKGECPTARQARTTRTIRVSRNQKKSSRTQRIWTPSQKKLTRVASTAHSALQTLCYRSHRLGSTMTSSLTPLGARTSTKLSRNGSVLGSSTKTSFHRVGSHRSPDQSATQLLVPRVENSFRQHTPPSPRTFTSTTGPATCRTSPIGP